jgi:hypothetical protein
VLADEALKAAIFISIISSKLISPVPFPVPELVVVVVGEGFVIEYPASAAFPFLELALGVL